MKQMQTIDATQVAEAVLKTTSLTLAQPFDWARWLYALGVRGGLLENSLLDCARFGRDISSLEKMTLGPWARQV
jgi:hypothetical protein